jgi:hypothetical protein
MPEFIWSRADDPYLVELKTRLNLSKLNREGLGDLYRVWQVCKLVHGLWPHDGVCTPVHADPLAILDEVASGKRFRCAEYTTVIQGCLAALDIRARYLALKTEDVETRETCAGHVVVEAYLRDHQRWAFIDGQFSAVPLLAEKPLSAWELSNALHHAGKALRLVGSSQAQSKAYFDWIKPYMFYLETRFDNRVSGSPNSSGFMLVPDGAKRPTIMQRYWSIENMTYTSEPDEFYPTPF